MWSSPPFNNTHFRPISLPSLRFFCHILFAVCTPSLVRLLLSAVPFLLSFPPPCSFTVWMFTHKPTSFSHCLPHPPFFSWVISLSSVCPSLCVCVLPSFVSDSFSREIRDAYLVPLYPGSATASFHLTAIPSENTTFTPLAP